MLLQRQKNCTRCVDNENEVQLHRTQGNSARAHGPCLHVGHAVLHKAEARPVARGRCLHLNLSRSLFQTPEFASGQVSSVLIEH